jgi:membrane protein implicated in regulation of membrane protease activity
MLKFILIVFLVFFILKFIAQYFLRSFLKNMQKNSSDQQTQYNQKKEGDVTINTKAKTGKKIDKDEGDYIDYEEIKE